MEAKEAYLTSRVAGLVKWNRDLLKVEKIDKTEVNALKREIG